MTEVINWPLWCQHFWRYRRSGLWINAASLRGKGGNYLGLPDGVEGV